MLSYMSLSTNKQTNKQTNERTNKKRTNERTNKQTNKRTNKQRNEQKTNKQTNKRTNKRTKNKQTNEQTNERTNKQTNIQYCKKMSSWLIYVPDNNNTYAGLYAEDLIFLSDLNRISCFLEDFHTGIQCQIIVKCPTEAAQKHAARWT